MRANMNEDDDVEDQEEFDEEQSIFLILTKLFFFSYSRYS
jgi:hypothetical protein